MDTLPFVLGMLRREASRDHRPRHAAADDAQVQHVMRCTHDTLEERLRALRERRTLDVCEPPAQER